MHRHQNGSVSEDFGKFILRVTLAVLILLHGVSKIMNGVTGIEGMVTKMGLPPAFAYLVYVGEVIAPLLVLVGLMTRPAALVIAVNMLFAFALAHSQDLFSMAKTGGWALELQGMYLASALAVAFLGAGRYSIGGQSGRWN